MERESFEDQEVAALLNAYFVAVKVDREERPDIDHIYMSVCQALTGSGGWPLTILMTPTKQPFFAGTYFPKHSHYGRPGLMDILSQISSTWQSDAAQLIEAGEKITHAVTAQLSKPQPGELSQAALAAAYGQFIDSFDTEFGGFGGAPKFPTPHTLTFLLRYYRQTRKPQALAMVEKTLNSMADGGIYDHIGFGFSRYSTDQRWLVPHFEKMLYDNALLAYALLETYQVTHNTRYATLAEEIFTYVLRDMTAPDGGFYSAEDADSEGIEGKYYVWHPEQITQILGPELGLLFCQAYDITLEGNFEGASIPNLINSDFTRLARQVKLSEGELLNKLTAAKAKLWRAREQRIHPHKDDKILTAWNGLMIAALAKGAQVLGKPAYAQAAAKAADFIRTKLMTDTGRLLARFRNGEAAILAHIDDYAFLSWGLIELYQADFNASHLTWALQLNADLVQYFWDDQSGGLFIYASDSEQLLSRPKEIYDGATPSGNSVAALNFLQLARLAGRPEFEQKAADIFRLFAGNVDSYPAGYTFLLQALWFALTPSLEIVLASAQADPASKQMLTIVHNKFLPEAVVMQYSKAIAELNPALAEQTPKGGKATAYVCQNFACQAPTTDPQTLAELLN